MTSKDINNKTKTSLMDELKSIKGVLNTDDDNIPLLLDDEAAADESIPVLAGDDDIPVLTSPDEAALNKASLDAAIRQLESMELSPTAAKAKPEKPADLTEKIRNNAAPPLFEDPKFDHKATTVRENPFMSKKPTDRFAESRKQAEEALMSVISHSRAISQQSSKPAAAVVAEEKVPVAAPKEQAPQNPIEFTAETTAVKPTKPTPQTASDEDASADILKLLDEEPAISLDIDDEFGELLDIDVDAMINEKSVSSTQDVAAKTTAPKSTGTPSLSSKHIDSQINTIVDEVIDEYMVILEAALRKKLKEKLPDLLKK